MIVQIAHVMRNSEVQFGQLDVLESGGVCVPFKILSYPHVMLFQGLDNFRTYLGVFREADIVAYLNRLSFPIISAISAISLEDFKSSNDVVVVGYLTPDDNDSHEAFSSLAEAMRADYLFGITNDSALAKAEQVDMPGIAVYKASDKEKKVLHLAHDIDQMSASLRAAARPLVTDFVSELHEDYLDPVKNLRLPLNEPRVPLEDELEGFVQDFLDGKLQPTIKSEPIPEESECPLIDVVALDYQDIVMDEEKDVLLEFCIKPCNPCKMLLPTLEKLARLYASTTKLENQVTIGTIIVEANDILDRGIQGFPTLKLYSAGSKDAPVFYSGTRTLKDMADFIRDHGKHKAEVPGIEEEQILEDKMTCSLDSKECAVTNGPNEGSEQAGVLKDSSIAQWETKPSGHDEL